MDARAPSARRTSQGRCREEWVCHTFGRGELGADHCIRHIGSQPIEVRTTDDLGAEPGGGLDPDLSLDITHLLGCLCDEQTAVRGDLEVGAELGAELTPQRYRVNEELERRQEAAGPALATLDEWRMLDLPVQAPGVAP